MHCPQRMPVIILALSLLFVDASPGAELPAIESVRLTDAGAFQVNGEPFFPLMIWLQNAENFPRFEACQLNTIAGYWGASGDDSGVLDYLNKVQAAGYYGVMPFDKRLAGHPALLGYIHGDEPDLPRLESDAEVVAAEGMKVNPSTPLWRLVDGVTHSWSVLDPLEDARITIRLDEPVSVTRLKIWLTISSGLAVARQVVLLGDGQQLAQATLEKEKGGQEIELSRPAAFRELTLQVRTTYPGEQVWGSISEIEGFNAAGDNVLLSPPRYVPRTEPPQVAEQYQRIKQLDSSRPVFMTLTGHFSPFFEKWSAEQRERLYPQYVAAADVVGYDIYPIYGYNKPSWIHLVHDATAQLKSLVGPKPIYAWIETSKGSRWVTFERQINVTPADIRAEVWMAICRGATAIGYFTHIWKPSYQQFGVPPKNQAALREINQQITRLAPAILADPVPGVRISSNSDVKLDVLARRHEGSIYLFAVNFDERREATTATIHLPGLSAGTTVEVIDEGRTLTAADGTLVDQFAPLAVHIYRVRKGGGVME